MSSAPIKSSRDNAAGGPQQRSGPQQPSDDRQTTATLPVNRYVVYFSLAAAGCAADLITKQMVFAWRGLPGQREPWWLIENRLGIQTSLNPGALFGMGAGWWWLFAAFSLVALAGIYSWLFVCRAAHDRWLTVALGCVTGGILGNLYDRLGLWNGGEVPAAFAHSVRDWILFQWPEVKLQIFNPWPNFNIADSLLVTGAIMLVVHAAVWRPEAAEQSDLGPKAKAA